MKSFDEAVDDINEGLEAFIEEVHRLRWSLGIYLGTVWIVFAGIAVWTHWL